MPRLVALDDPAIKKPRLVPIEDAGPRLEPIDDQTDARDLQNQLLARPPEELASLPAGPSVVPPETFLQKALKTAQTVAPVAKTVGKTVLNTVLPAPVEVPDAIRKPVEDFLVTKPEAGAEVLRNALTEKVSNLLAPTEADIEKKAGQAGKVPYFDIAKRSLFEAGAKLASKAIPMTPADVATVGLGSEGSLAKPYDDIKQALTDWATTKKVKVPVSADEIKDFFTFGKDKLTPETYDILQKMDPEELKALAKARQGTQAEVRVPRFGKGNEPRLEPVLEPSGKRYLDREFPGLTQKAEIGGQESPENVQNALLKASAAGEEAKIQGASPAQASAQAARVFDESMPSKDVAAPALDPKNSESTTPKNSDSAQEMPQERRFPANYPSRIQPAPIEGHPVKPLRDIAFDASKAYGRKLFFSKPAKGSIGTYYPGSAKTVVKYSNDLDTTAHELSHSLDDRFGIVGDWNKPGFVAPFDEELEKFWYYGSAAMSGPRSDLRYKRAEGVAEYVRAWLVNPQDTEKAAPEFAKFFKQKVPRETLAALQSFSNDIRAFASASAHQQIMANVNWRPPKTTFTKWLGKDPGPGFSLTWADKQMGHWVDDLHAFHKAVEYARGEKGIETQLPKNDATVLARLYMGVNSKTDQIFETGMINAQNKTVTPGGINYLLEPLDQTSTKTLEDEMQETVSYMLAQRTIEKANQLGLPRVSGIGGGIYADVDVAKKRLAELKSTPGKFMRIEEAARRYREWGDALLQYLVQKGRISAESYSTIKANNEYYVAMQRIMETSPNEEINFDFGKTPKKLGMVNQPIKRFKGSTKTIENPYSSLMDSTYKSIKEADRNDVLRQFRDLLTKNPRGMYDGPVQDLASVAHHGRQGDMHTIPIYVDGKKEIWQFHPEIYKALKGMLEGSYQLPPLLTVLPRILRATVVNFPPFAVRNIIRDIQQRVVVSDVGSRLLDSFKKRGPMDVQNLKLFGGDQAGHYLRDSGDYIRSLDATVRDLAKDKNTIVALPSKLGNKYMDFMQGFERSGRLAEYEAALRHAKDKLGYDDENAMLFAASKARDLMDFAVAGNVMRIVNQVIPFSNASVQAVRRTFRAANERPKDFAAKWGTYILMPTLAVYAYNKLFSNKGEYDQQPAYLKDMFYNFKVGPNLWLRIPKSYEMGVMAAGVERLLDKANGNPHAFEGYAGSLARSLLPVDESALSGPFRGLVQAFANHDFLRQKSIVPNYEDKLDLKLRNTASASRLGQALQKAVGVDARKIDFLMREMFGYVGGALTDISDIGRPDKRSKEMFLKQTGLFAPSPAFAARGRAMGDQHSGPKRV
jgi:hypothetical protein